MPLNPRLVVTESSVWIFDLDNMRYLRLPASEAPAASHIAYTGEWDDFTRLQDLKNGHLMVHRPVPFGTGCLRQTGLVLEDTGQGDWPTPEEP